MIELKPDEIRLWEQVYVAYTHTGLSSDAAKRADKAVKFRRERFNAPSVGPYSAYREEK